MRVSDTSLQHLPAYFSAAVKSTNEIKRRNCSLQKTSNTFYLPMYLFRAFTYLLKNIMSPRSRIPTALGLQTMLPTHWLTKRTVTHEILPFKSAEYQSSRKRIAATVLTTLFCRAFRGNACYDIVDVHASLSRLRVKNKRATYHVRCFRPSGCVHRS